MMRYSILGLSVTFLALPASAAELAEIRGGRTMGTSYSVKWVPREDEDVDRTRMLIHERLDRVNALMSTYDPESELSRFNSSRETDWFEVATETALVVRRALEIAELSGGAFDPTVGRLVRLWSFGSGARTYEPPDEETIRAALEVIGYRRVQVRDDPPALRKDHPDVELDLSAIAKGFGVDEVARTLEEQGIEHLFVEIGGEIVVRGTRDGRPWKAGIERPEALGQGLHSTIELADSALATSGDYRNFYERDGVRYSHTIDPTTGRPVTHQLASVSVLAEDCMTADALATALLVLGPQAGPALAEEHRIAALFLIHRGTEMDAIESTAAAGRFLPVSGIDDRLPARRHDELLTTIVLTAVVFSLAILALGVGVLFSNRPLQGSCGGARGLKDEQGRSICEMCSTPPEQCEKFREQLARGVDGNGDE